MTGFRVMSGGALIGVGLDTLPADNFILGTTEPTMSNTGVPAGTVLTPYSSDIVTPQTVVISTPGTLIEDKDMGNIRLDVRAAGVTIRRCRWIVTNNRTTTAMVRTDQIAANGDCVVEQCTIDNRDQMGYQFNAVQGHNVTVYRCKILGTVDGVRPNIAGNVKVRGCFIGFLGWWGTESGKPSLNSGFQTHSDCIQTTYAGVEIVGNSLWAYPSDVVGTGTPGNGTDTGNPDGWYTQAQSDARRATLIPSMTNPAQSPDGVSHRVNTYLTPIMCNVATGSTALNLTVTDNWFAGGGVHVNALASNLTNPLGTFHRNRHYNDAESKAAGKSYGYRVRADLTPDIPTTGPNVNTYMDGAGVVTKV